MWIVENKETRQNLVFLLSKTTLGMIMPDFFNLRLSLANKKF